MDPFLLKILLWFSALAFLGCGSFAPKAGVFTEITSIKSSVVYLYSGDQYYSNTISNNTIMQTLTQAQDYVINHGGIKISGYFTVYLAQYCCLNTDKVASYLKIFKRDNIPVNNTIQYNKLAPSSILQRVDDMDFNFDVTFDDPTISTPESHVYTL